MSVKYYVMGFLLCISQMSNDVEHISICIFAICIFLFVKCMFTFPPHCSLSSFVVLVIELQEFIYAGHQFIVKYLF